MVQRFLALARSRNEDFQLIADLGLPDVLIEQLGRSARSIASSLGEAGAASMMRCSVKLSVWMLMQCAPIQSRMVAGCCTTDYAHYACQP
jgi:Rod binding domain-containing protein